MASPLSTPPGSELGMTMIMMRMPTEHKSQGGKESWFGIALFNLHRTLSCNQNFRVATVRMFEKNMLIPGPPH